ncbi:MAG: type IV-A pilus assembly ATPase PilB, partial [Desulfotignum sp.]
MPSAFAKRKPLFPDTSRDLSGAGNTRIGEILSKEGQITSLQLDEALMVQKKTGERLSAILLAKGYIDPDTIINVLGRLYNFTVIRYADMTPDPGALKM